MCRKMWRAWRNCWRDRFKLQVGTGWYLDPSPGLFVSVDSKGVSDSVSLLESTLRRHLASVASKGFKFTVGRDNFSAAGTYGWVIQGALLASAIAGLSGCQPRCAARRYCPGWQRTPTGD